MAATRVTQERSTTQQEEVHQVNMKQLNCCMKTVSWRGISTDSNTANDSGK